MPDDFDDDDLAGLAAQMQGWGQYPVGSSEEELRSSLGDARYEAVMKFNDDCADANLAGIIASVRLTEAQAAAIQVRTYIATRLWVWLERKVFKVPKKD